MINQMGEINAYFFCKIYSCSLFGYYFNILQNVKLFLPKISNDYRLIFSGMLRQIIRLHIQASKHHYWFGPRRGIVTSRCNYFNLNVS